MSIQQCDRCLLYPRSPHIHCAIHPYGPEDNDCPDFREDPNLQHNDEELWAPAGYAWYGDELIRNAPPRLTPEQQLELLNTHPFFTGHCPQCSYKFDNPLAWDCPACGWVDDAV